MSSVPKILHEASGVIGLWKPSGLPTQAPPGIASAEAWLRERLGPGRYLGVPHRLDRGVSGIMLFASTPRAARQLSRQFERRTVSKAYLALAAAEAAAGAVAALEDAPEGVTWTDILEKVPDEPRARVVTAASGGGKPAAARARLLGRFPAMQAVLLYLEPQTGRMHQLRVQAAARGLPILGDTLYGGPLGPFVSPADPRQAAIALHAWRITFTDPGTAALVTLQAPLPAAWPADVTRAVSRLWNKSA
jgi:23S rRNA pseudouridine1911/1915/1917 synthase